MSLVFIEFDFVSIAKYFLFLCPNLSHLRAFKVFEEFSLWKTAVNLHVDLISDFWNHFFFTIAQTEFCLTPLNDFIYCFNGADSSCTFSTSGRFFVYVLAIEEQIDFFAKCGIINFITFLNFNYWRNLVISQSIPCCRSLKRY